MPPAQDPHRCRPFSGLTAHVDTPFAEVAAESPTLGESRRECDRQFFAERCRAQNRVDRGKRSADIRTNAARFFQKGRQFGSPRHDEARCESVDNHRGNGDLDAMSQRARNTIPRISILAVVLALRVFAQVAEVRLSEGKLRITTVQGRQYELEESNGSEQSLRVSPGRTKVFYHLPFDGYGTKHELVAKVWSFADPDRAAQLQVWIKSRFIDRVEWIDDRYVLVAGDGRGVVVDTENPGVTHRLWGGRLAISPGRKKLLYVQAVGRAPRELISNVAAVAVVGMGTNPTHGPPESMESGVHEVYPPESDPTRGTPAPIPERRHVFLTGICGSPTANVQCWSKTRIILPGWLSCPSKC